MAVLLANAAHHRSIFDEQRTRFSPDNDIAKHGHLMVRWATDNCQWEKKYVVVIKEGLAIFSDHEQFVNNEPELLVVPLRELRLWEEEAELWESNPVMLVVIDDGSGTKFHFSAEGTREVREWSTELRVAKNKKRG